MIGLKKQALTAYLVDQKARKKRKRQGKMNKSENSRPPESRWPLDPAESLAEMHHEFGEHGGVNMSIEASTTFSVMDAKTLPAIFRGQVGPDHGGCFLYGRHFNPTVYNLGKQLAQMEGSETGYCTSSGMGAISSTVLQFCNSGDEILASHTIYGGTFAFFKDFLPLKCGIKTNFVDILNLDLVEKAFTKNTRILYIETMSNPMLSIPNIPKLADLAHKHGVKLVVDNTFTPLIVTPIKWGADVVVHSLTKFINGASDIIAGAICGSTSLIESLMDLHLGSMMLLGPTLDPHSASSIGLRIPHLSLRMKEHSHRALIFAQRLEELKVPVIYPGLPSHPGRSILDQIRNKEYGYGGLLCIDMETTERAYRLMDLLQNREKFGIMAVSLGYSETLMTCPSSTTSSELSEEELKNAGIRPGLVRLSIGYTGTLEQRWSQFERALRKIRIEST